MADGRESRVFSTKSLYELSVSAVADKFLSYKGYLTYLPENVLFDLYYQVNAESVATATYRHHARCSCICFAFAVGNDTLF